MLIVFSFFPQIVFKMSELVGTQAPANFIFLFIIFVLIVRMFQMSMKISQLESKLKDLVARIAIDENIRKGEVALGSDAVSGNAGISGCEDCVEKEVNS